MIQIRFYYTKWIKFRIWITINGEKVQNRIGLSSFIQESVLIQIIELAEYAFVLKGNTNNLFVTIPVLSTAI